MNWNNSANKNCLLLHLSSVNDLKIKKKKKHQQTEIVNHGFTTKYKLTNIQYFWVGSFLCLLINLLLQVILSIALYSWYHKAIYWLTLTFHYLYSMEYKFLNIPCISNTFTCHCVYWILIEQKLKIYAKFMRENNKIKNISFKCKFSTLFIL